MNWLELNDHEVLEIITPMMDNLMNASTEINHAKHIQYFSDNMKSIVTKDNLEKQCKEYQNILGVFTKRELIGIIKKKKDVRVFWRQFYSKSTDEFLSFIHVVKNVDRFEIVNVSVS